MTADFAVKITVRNGRLLRAIRAQYGSSAEMCRKCGISQTSVAALLTMKKSPVTTSGEWSKAAFDISSALDMEPESLWPSHIAQIKLVRNEAEIDLSLEDVQNMLQPARFAARKAIAHFAKGIPERHMRALVMQVSGATNDEIAEELGVCGTRAYQILANTHRRMRRSAEKQGIRSVADVGALA